MCLCDLDVPTVAKYLPDIFCLHLDQLWIIKNDFTYNFILKCYCYCVKVCVCAHVCLPMIYVSANQRAEGKLCGQFSHLPFLSWELNLVIWLASCTLFGPQLFSYFKYEIVVRHCIDKQDVLSCYIGWAQIGRPLNLFRMHKSGPECTNVYRSWWTDSTKCMFFSSSLMIWIQPRRKSSEGFFSDNWNLSSCEQIDMR